MNFFSSEFVLFIVSMFIAYWIIPQRYRNLLILIGGYVFYAFAGIQYTLILAIFTVSSYCIAKEIEKKVISGDKPKWLLTVGILIPIISLFIFKYLNFTVGIFYDIAGVDFNAFDIILPVGISFYSFQIVGYLVDVYRGDAVAEKNIITYGAYIAFFPQLLSGPIARTKTLLPQFQKSHVFNYDFAVHSLKRFAVGFFEKYFIASKMGAFVDYIYGDINGYSGGVLFGMSIMYTLQIYFDFAGYTNMAIGFAGLFDYKLDENFNSPYLSQSVRDFWARWHMSLTKWLRDYIYIPLGGNRCSRARNSFNVFVTFLISGLWHGANYTFIVWGAIHGLAQVIENLFGVKKYKESKGVLGWIRILVVFLFVNFAWIFFRAPDMTTALHVVAGYNGLEI